MTDLKNERRGGFYFKNNKPYISVTTVLEVIEKPSLRYWFGQQVYYAMLKDPSLKEREALLAPYKTSDKAKNRGTTIHSVVEAYKAGHAPDLKGIPEEFQGYVRAFYRFVKEINPTILEQEKTIFDDNMYYAGTLDMKATIGGKVYVIDIKTGKDIYPEAFLQTAAYANALEEKIDGIAVVLLKEDGTYKFETKDNFTIDFNGFMAARELYIAINQEKLKKIGYTENKI